MSNVKQISLNVSEAKEFLTHIITNNRYLQENGKLPVATEVIGDSGIGKTSTIIQLAD
jgi:flagellar biosynthesis GTPase FlhF